MKSKFRIGDTVHVNLTGEVVQSEIGFDQKITYIIRVSGENILQVPESTMTEEEDANHTR